MRFISILLMFFGYMLVYAATAAGGKFALEPWLGLFADAYTETTGIGPKLPTPPGSKSGYIPPPGGWPGGQTPTGRPRGGARNIPGGPIRTFPGPGR